MACVRGDFPQRIVTKEPQLSKGGNHQEAACLLRVLIALAIGNSLGYSNRLGLTSPSIGREAAGSYSSLPRGRNECQVIFIQVCDARVRRI